MELTLTVGCWIKFCKWLAKVICLYNYCSLFYPPSCEQVLWSTPSTLQAAQIKFNLEEAGGPSVYFVSGFGLPLAISNSINCGLVWACFRPQMNDKGATGLTGPDKKSCNRSLSIATANVATLLHTFKTTCKVLDAKQCEPSITSCRKSLQFVRFRIWLLAEDFPLALYLELKKSADDSSANCSKRKILFLNNVFQHNLTSFSTT